MRVKYGRARELNENRGGVVGVCLSVCPPVCRGGGNHALAG